MSFVLTTNTNRGIGARKLKIQKNGVDIATFSANELEVDDDLPVTANIVVPTNLSDLSDDTTHRLVSDTEKATWNAKSDFSGSYNDLTDTPTLGTAAAKDVPSSGNASTSQVVMGNDSRLTNSRPASDVSAWAKASTKPSYTASEVGAIATTAKGAASGVAELDSNGKVPSSQLPSYVDDVLEYNSLSNFPTTGETGKIYVAKDTNKTYRWSGTAYVEISPSLALGETSSTAYRGDRGKTAYDHSQTTSGNPHNVTKSDVGLGNVGNFKAVSTVASQGLTDTEKSNARTNIGAGTSSLALGTSSSTAFRGDYGNSAYAHAVTNKGSAFSSGLYKITTNSEGHVTAATAVAKADITALGIPGSDTNNRKSFYGTCDTAGDTAAKVVTLSDTTGWELKAGTIVGVKFTNKNTASSVTLNVNGSGAKSIWYNTAVYTDSSANVCGAAGMVIYYMYDGTNWAWLNMGKLDGNTDTKVRQTLSTTNKNYPLLLSYAESSNTTGNVDNVSYRANAIYANPSTGNIQATKLNGVDIGSSPKFTDTTYSSKAAASGGTDVSLCTTGEKYTWNSKAAGNHTHTASLAADTGTSAISLAANSKYKLTAGGSSVIFTTPPDTNTWRGIQDNLTSSTNTTESLSAKQGYLLANGSARDSTKLPLAGGTMTGQLLTSFKNSVAMGSYQATSTTIADLCNELRYSSGCCGSFSLSTAYTKDNVTIGTGWYNFLWIPHRSGGVNGAASGDNCNYGTCIIAGMTVAGACYILRYASGAISELKNVYADTNTTYAAGTGVTISGTNNAINVTYGTAANTACQGNDSRLSNARTPTSHTHGNIQNGGTLQTNDVAIANGDKLVVTDSSDSAKVARTSLAFDGSTATKCLTQKGTWETFAASDTNNRKSFFGTCATAGATAAKEVTLVDSTGWELKAGTIVAVKFTNSNSANNPTINVNGSGAKSIWYRNAVVTGNQPYLAGYANDIISYIYDGTYWVWLGIQYNVPRLFAGASNTSNQNVATTNGNTHLIMHMGNTTFDRRKIAGTQGINVTSDSSGNISIGEHYVDVTNTLSTTTDTTYTFTDSRITTSSAIDVYASIFGVNPKSVSVASGSCTVVFPKYSSAASMTARIYIK